MSYLPLAVQKAVLEALGIALAGDVPVYDHVPDDALFPFVELSSQQVLDNDADGMPGFEHNFFLTVWSEYRGQKEIWEILGRIHTGLHDRKLILESGTQVNCRVTGQRTELDQDGLTYQGAVTLRIVTNR